MIQTIEINIKSGSKELVSAIILYPKNICYKNNQKYHITKDFLEDIVRTIRLWKNEYGSDNKLDSEEFNIVVKTKDNEEKFHGKGIFPENYRSIKELLGDLHG